MILQYGNYRHALDEAAIVISRTALVNDARVPYAVRERWHISGVLQAASPAGITSAIAGLQTAYATDGLDVTLLLSDGVTPTAHRLRSSDASGGVRVTTRPSFPRGMRAEYSTFRSYELTLEAELPTASAAANLLAWDEVLSFQGGGPRDVLLELRNGPPQQQRVSQATTFTVVQSGRAIGYRAYPAIPNPIWPAAEDRPSRRIVRRLPRSVGSGANRALTHFEVTWSFTFHSSAPLASSPTQRPR